MIEVEIEISGKHKSVTRNAVIDTGFTGGLLLPQSIARSVGAILVKPRRLPRTVDGRKIPGLSTILRIAVEAADVEAETIVFCPDATTRHTLLGAFFLAQTHGSIHLGDMEYEFLMPNPNLDPYDLGDMVIPLDRPEGPWL